MSGLTIKQNMSEIGALWRGVDSLQQKGAPNMITDIDYESGYAVEAGSDDTINGTGFKEG